MSNRTTGKEAPGSRTASNGISIGYARVSTLDQNLALQKDALARAQCDRVFTDTASGAKADRPGLAEALSHLRKGDTLVVWKLDRLGRSLKNLIEVTQDLEKKGIGLKGFCSRNGKNRTLRLFPSTFLPPPGQIANSDSQIVHSQDKSRL